MLTFKKYNVGGTWVAQSVERPTLAQVMISQFVSLSPTSGSLLTAYSMEQRERETQNLNQAPGSELSAESLT